jgi:hypothetical protein
VTATNGLQRACGWQDTAPAQAKLIDRLRRNASAQEMQIEDLKKKVKLLNDAIERMEDS